MTQQGRGADFMLRHVGDTVLWRNRARYWLKRMQEKFVLGSSLRDTPSFSFNDHQLYRWTPHCKHGDNAEPERLKRRFVECPAQPGLWVCLQALGPADKIESIRHFATVACGPLPWEAPVKVDASSVPKRAPSHWSWHEYDPARCVAPILLGQAAEDLFDFEVFDKVPPDQWLRLGLFARHETASAGARVLGALPRQLRSHIQNDCEAQMALLKQMSVCSFLQLQVRLGSTGLTQVAESFSNVDC